MCYVISMKRIRREMEEYYNRLCGEDVDFAKRVVASGFEFPEWPLILSEAPDCFQAGGWGLIPSWTDSEAKAAKLREGCLNARGETVFTLSSFKKSIFTKRCVVPVTGFFEWMSFAGKKYPHYIFPRNETYFSLGGIYDEWRNPKTGVAVRTFSILTTEANARMAEIHNTKKRMPLILEKNQISNWLDSSISKDEIEKMILPFPNEHMSDFTLAKFSFNGSRENEKALMPLEYPELAFLK